MRIHADPRFVESKGDNEVRSFSSHPSETQEFFQRIGNFSVETFEQITADTVKCVGFRVIESDGKNRFFDCLDGKGEEGLRGHFGKRPFSKVSLCQREEAAAGTLRHLIFCPKTQKAGDQNIKGVIPAFLANNPDRWNLPALHFFLKIATI